MVIKPGDNVFIKLKISGSTGLCSQLNLVHAVKAGELTVSESDSTNGLASIIWCGRSKHREGIYFYQYTNKQGLEQISYISGLYIRGDEIRLESFIDE